MPYHLLIFALKILTVDILPCTMGLLTVGSPLNWPETKKNAAFIREQGIKEFLLLYHKLNSRLKHTLKWGDEIEYTLVHIDPLTGSAQLYLGATELLKSIKEKENNTSEEIIWQPEYAEYMIEGVPGIPFGRLLHAFSTVECNMKKRRLNLITHLPQNCIALTISAFPRYVSFKISHKTKYILGCDDFCYPAAKPTPESGVSRSLFFPDAAINQGHPRFQTLTRNIRERRGAKVVINAPIYQDTCTPQPFIEKFPNQNDLTPALPNHVYLDAMGFGMGCSCLQITFQACCIDEARILYDQLTTICPIIMALSAATPAIRGYLLDWDCRWGIISASVDDRTEEERGLKPLRNDQFVIPKSRFSSVSFYLSPMGAKFNDIPLVYNNDYYNTLIEGGVDDTLALHVAHLFIRDPISIFSESLTLPENEETVEHFETIQSTNWQSMRFKPPPLNSSIGWRVEFRPTELQLTDFENAAFVTFILLLSRTILKFKLNLLIPLSKVDANIATALKRDAVLNGKFYFKRGHLITTDGSPIDLTKSCSCFKRHRTYSTRCDPSDPNCIFSHDAQDTLFVDPFEHHIKASSSFSSLSSFAEVEPDDSYMLMSVNEIINGTSTFPGLLPLIRHYVQETGGHLETIDLINSYMDLIQKRASVKLLELKGIIVEKRDPNS
ncbi:Glutamate--cysteine ligase catalytic subunit [Schistosoma japonicum]|nr:Glutamate--cysteine ligase catalytic subunit [Schistosoma japonicum]